MDEELVKMRKLPPERLWEITLGKGIHLTRGQGVCAMETVAWLAGRNTACTQAARPTPSPGSSAS